MTWKILPLTEVAEVRLGRQRSPKNHSGNTMRPYLRAANVSWSGLLLDDVKTMNFTDAEMDTYRLQPGDIVLSEASGSPGEVGKPALWKGEIDDCAFQNTLIRVRPMAHDPRFLLHYFRYVALTGGFLPSSRGVGINHLGRTRLASWPTPLPTVDEQQRIVEILEEHLSHLDAAADHVSAARRRLRAMQKATLLEMIPDRTNYPSEWRTATVAEAGKVELGRQRHPDWHTGPNMQPYLRVANVFEDRIDTADVKEMHWDGDTFERFRLHPGDVLLNEGQTPDLLGRPALYRGEPPNVAFTNSLIRFKASPDVLPEFALFVFRRHMHAGRFKRESRITTNIAHLSAARLKPIEFPIPSLEAQTAIVQDASTRLADIARLEGTISSQTARAHNLRRAVLAAAFSGKLTGRRSDDEVVEELAGALE